MVERRKFMQHGAASLAAVVLAPASSLTVAGAADAVRADALIAGKDPRLVVHTSAPAVFETPPALLTDAITPVRLLFVRNNQQPADAATIKPPSPAGWKVELAGLVDRAASIDGRTLAKLVQVEREMVLQCSGNSRALFAAAAPVQGTPWGRGAMGNVVFGGVPLADVLTHAGITVQPQARFVTAEGRDEPAAGEQDFEHSLPLDEALKKSIIALRINGEPLPADARRSAAAGHARLLRHDARQMAHAAAIRRRAKAIIPARFRAIALPCYLPNQARISTTTTPTASPTGG